MGIHLPSKPSPLFFIASLLVFSGTAIQTFLFGDGSGVQAFEDILLAGAMWLVRELYHFIGEVPQKTCGPGQDLRYLEGNIASSWIKMARLITRRDHPILSGGQSILR